MADPIPATIGAEAQIHARLVAGATVGDLILDGFKKSTIYKVRAARARGRTPGRPRPEVELHRLLDRVIAKGPEVTKYADIILRALAGELTQAETVAAMNAYGQLFREPWRVLMGISDVFATAPPRRPGTITEVDR